MPLLAAFILSGLAVLLPPQSPASQAPLPARDTAVASRSASTGVIRGRVITASGEPIRRATVMVVAAELKTSRSAATDADGRFEFQHLPAAKITVAVTKTGFASTSYGQKRPFQSARAIELAAGQVVDKIEVVMPRAAVISGRVLNDLGEPSPGVTVVALRRRFTNGTLSLGMAGIESTTDDLGQYRLSGLPAGSYYVMTFRPGGLVEVGSAPEDPVAMGNTFHASAASIGEARPVTLRVGQEVRGVDVTQMAVKPSTISGVLLDSAGRPATDGTLGIRSFVAGPAGPGLAQTVAMSMMAGRWTLKNVLPGEYVISGEVTNSETKQRETSTVKVTVFDADLDGVVVQAMPPPRVTGRVLIDSERQARPSASQIRVAAIGRDGRVGAAAIPSSADWTFELRNVSSDGVRLVAQNLPDGWAFEAVRQGEAEVTDLYLDTGPGTAVTVDVVVTDRVTSMAGSVTTAEGKPAQDCAVVVFSADPARWTLGARAIAVTRPHQSGAYSVTALPPGAYYAIALEYVDDGEEANPELLGWARARAARVDLAGGTTVALDLTLVPYEGGL